uniref:Myoneurin-like n=1 Tax=Diabrotica virgifera virgifera TaxID=50390 RepID=A0A6P7HF54_DIAVI
MFGVERINKCVECGNVYKRKHDLKRHVNSSHPDKLDAIAPLKVLKGNVYKCAHCDKQFRHKQSLNFHVKKMHTNVSVSAETKTFQHKCSLCDYHATFKKDFIKHYETSHSIPMQYDTIEFSNHDDFISWKNKIELETNASFVVETGKKAGIMNYICHRSGYFTSKGKGERHLKTHGSVKINGYCPAMIKEVAQSDGKYLAHFTKTHVGHQNAIGRLFLPSSERKTIAAKLAAKIPFEAVLDGVRDGISDTDKFQRKHLLTKKDLYNIEASFNLRSTTVRHRDDAVSLESWVNEMKTSCVLFYKPQDITLDEYPQLHSDDFILIIMNTGQLTTLKKFGSDCICVDGTHGVNSYQFELHTLLVLDDLRQGFPCCFCICSRSDETIMSLFFNCIKKESGPIEARVFMSDMADVYYNAWSKLILYMACGSCVEKELDFD